MPATQTDYNNTGDRDSYSCPSNALSPCPALKEPEKAEKEYEEVWKNKPHFLEGSISWVLCYYSQNTKTSEELGVTESPDVDDVIWLHEDSCAWS